MTMRQLASGTWVLVDGQGLVIERLSEEDAAAWAEALNEGPVPDDLSDYADPDYNIMKAELRYERYVLGRQF